MKKNIRFTLLFFLSFTGPGAWAQTPTPTACDCPTAQLTYGSSGSGDGQWNGANQLAFGRTSGVDYLYVADINNHRVDQFNASTGAWVANFNGVGSNNPYGGMNTPFSVAISTDGNYLFVGSTNGDNVVKLDLTNGGLPVTAFAVNHPIALTVDPLTGDIYSADDYTVRKFHEASPNYYVEISVMGDPLNYGTAVTQFHAAQGILVQGNDVYVADTTNGRIVRWRTTDGVNYAYASTVYSNSVGIAPGQMVLEPGTTRVHVAGANNTGYLVFDESTTPWTLLYQCNPSGSQGSNGIAMDAGGFYSTIFTLGPQKFPKVAPACYAPVVLPTNTPSYYQGTHPPSAGDCFVYPSPAKGDQATVSCRLAQAGRIEVRIYNQTGDRVLETTVSQPPGVQVASFSIVGFASGVYYCSVSLKYDSGGSEKLKIKKFAVIH
jgi:hypothetical protein